MTSVLNVDTIAAKNGTSPVALTKQSAAKAWNNMNGTGTAAIRDSFNIASITDVGTAEYKHNLSNNMSTADSYSMTGFARCSANAGFFGGIDNSVFTSGVIYHGTYGAGATSAVDALYVTISVHGDLA